MIAALVLAADAAAVVAHGVGRSSADTEAAASASGDAYAAATVIPHSEPVHWASTHAPALETRGSGTTNTAESTNWSGYIDDGPTFTQVTADWVVPTVQTTQASQYSSTWIGIDGTVTNTLIQTGTAQDTSANTTDYFAWYELLPGAAVPVGNVAPGDDMQANIVEDSPGRWTITIDDVTAWASPFSTTVSYSTPGDSAEWIEEAPNVDNQQSTLADFGTARFTSIGVTDSKSSSVKETPVNMINQEGATIATPGSLAGGSFTVTYVGPVPISTAPSSGPPPAHGYWLVGSDGGIFTFGSAQFYGSTGSLRLQRPVVGISPTSDLGGYWLVASDGGVFTFGDAGFYGSIPGLAIAPAGSAGPGKKLNAPIVGIVPSSDGGGYFMVASDGGVFAFGDAKFEGSCPGIAAIGGCAGAGVAVMPDATGNGYWLVTATGNVYTFGDAAYYGAPGPQASPVTSAVRTPDGGGYWILLANGAVYGYGDALNIGGPVGSVGGANPATAIFTTADGGGYWVAAANGAVWSYGDAPNDGGMAGTKLNGSIIAASGF
ncbi:MAG: G1 family glutamic endopeptidase [Acidimicrobiales bacterium]